MESQPIFERRLLECTADMRNQSGNFVNRGLAKRRRLLEQDLKNDQLTADKVSNHSHFLCNQHENNCFYGAHLIDSIQHEFPCLSRRHIEGNAELLFKYNYIQPVMPFVREMSNCNVCYRYADDAQRIKESNRDEIFAMHQLAKRLSEQTSLPFLSGKDILGLLIRGSRTGIKDWSHDPTTTSLSVVTRETSIAFKRLCQKMLLHGSLVPIETDNPTRYQRFSSRYRYYFCDGYKITIDLIRQFQDNVEACVFATSDERENFTPTNYDTENKSFSISRTFGRTCSESAARRRSEDLILQWTLDCKDIVHVLPWERETEDDTSLNERTRLSSRIILSPDFAVLKDCSVLLPSYTPPNYPNYSKFTHSCKRIHKKLKGARFYKIRDKKTSVDSVSSIDAEWSVY